MMDAKRKTEFIRALGKIVGAKHVLRSPGKLKHYQTGYRIGAGKASAVVLPRTLQELWQTLKVCVEFDTVVIMQAANTGLNGGSTPYGDDYDRDVVVINTLKLNKIIPLNQGRQVIGLAGSTLYELEDILEDYNRTPHSVIGSSCIGASIVGGVCNNSGGALVNRGPAYTELSLFAQLTDSGELQLVNHLDIDLGETPEEILRNLESGRFETNPSSSNKLASDMEYQDRVRDVNADTPARFNADKRRLYEASGCAGKLAVFAVRLDTFEAPVREQVFYIGTNDPTRLTELRKRVLSEMKVLPELGEYMHRSYFEAAYRYCKDTYLFIKYLGASFLPQLFKFKSAADGYLKKIPLLPEHFIDHVLQRVASLLPNHLPKRLRNYHRRFEHQLMIKANDEAIAPFHALLKDVFSSEDSGEFFLCDKKEGDAALLHRFVAGGASVRYAIIHKDEVGGLMPFDIAFPRNDEDWHKPLPADLQAQLAGPFILSHFFCHVFHHDFVVKKDVNMDALKAALTERLERRGAKYPAEHNVGQYYTAEPDLRNFYQMLDPTNSFNPGIGKTSKKKHYA